MKKKIDLVHYLENELSDCINRDFYNLDYSVWIIKKLAVIYAEISDKDRFGSLRQKFEIFFRAYKRRKATKELEAFLDDLEIRAFPEDFDIENIFTEMIEQGILDLDNPEPFINNALSFISFASGFMSDQYMMFLDILVELMIKTGKQFCMIEIVDSLIKRADDENLGDAILFDLLGYSLLLYMDIDKEKAYQIERERIELCMENYSEMLANEVSAFLQMLGLDQSKDEFFSMLEHFLDEDLFSDEELLVILSGACASFDMLIYKEELERVIVPCIESICSRSFYNLDVFLTARRILINFYSFTRNNEKVWKYLNEDLDVTLDFYGIKSLEYKSLVDCLLLLNNESENGNENLKYIEIARKNGWDKDDKSYSLILQLYEASAYYSNGEYERSRKLALLTMFQFMVSQEEDFEFHWIEALNIVAKCEKAEGDVLSAQKHFETILEEALRNFGPDAPYVKMIGEQLESLEL